MHIFCAVMCVETPFIYHKARKLLLAACPSGALVALWQFFTLLRYTADIRQDIFGQVAACLLLIRVSSGIAQTLGLFQLSTLQPAVSKGDLTTLPAESMLIKNRLQQL